MIETNKVERVPKLKFEIGKSYRLTGADGEEITIFTAENTGDIGFLQEFYKNGKVERVEIKANFPEAKKDNVRFLELSNSRFKKGKTYQVITSKGVQMMNLTVKDINDTILLEKISHIKNSTIREIGN